MPAERVEKSVSQHESLERKRRFLRVAVPLWILAATLRLIFRSYDQSLTTIDLLLFGFVVISLLILSVLLLRSVASIPSIMIGLFFIISISVLISFLEVLFSNQGELIKENSRFLDLAFWFPLVAITAYLAFDLKKGLYAIIGFWVIVVPALGIYLFNSPEIETAITKLAFITRFLIANALFILLVDLWAHVNSQTLSHETQARLQEELANTDYLTGIPNRRAITKILADEFSKSKEKGDILSVITFDIRSLKRINDQFGHPYGDTVLIQVAESGRSIIRAFDTIARFGGDEFLILLPKTNVESAGKIGERFKALIQNIVLPDGSRLDIALGIASSQDQSDFYSMISEADRDLYGLRAAVDKPS